MGGTTNSTLNAKGTVKYDKNSIFVLISNALSLIMYQNIEQEEFYSEVSPIFFHFFSSFSSFLFSVPNQMKNQEIPISKDLKCKWLVMQSTLHLISTIVTLVCFIFRQAITKMRWDSEKALRDNCHGQNRLQNSFKFLIKKGNYQKVPIINQNTTTYLQDNWSF